MLFIPMHFIFISSTFKCVDKLSSFPTHPIKMPNAATKKVVIAIILVGGPSLLAPHSVPHL